MNPPLTREQFDKEKATNTMFMLMSYEQYLQMFNFQNGQNPQRMDVGEVADPFVRPTIQTEVPKQFQFNAPQNQNLYRMSTGETADPFVRPNTTMSEEEYKKAYPNPWDSPYANYNEYYVAETGKAQMLSTPLLPKTVMDNPETITSEENTVPDTQSVETVSENKRKSILEQVLNTPNLGMGVSLDDRFRFLGESLKYNTGFLEGTGLQKTAKTANLLKGIAAGGAGLLGVARNVMEGMGYQNRQNEFYKEYFKDIKNLNTSTYKYKDGGSIISAPFEKMASGEYEFRLPKNLEHMANAELEGKEFKIQEDGKVKEVVGNSHKDGGVKTIIQETDKIVSNHLKLNNPDVVSKIESEYGIKVNKKDTYANVISKFNDKSGITTLNKEIEKVFKKIKENDDVMDKSTREINAMLLQKELNSLKEEKAKKEVERTALSNFLYEKQQASKNIVEKIANKYGKDVNTTVRMFQEGGSMNEMPDVQEIIKMYSQMAQMPEETLQQEVLGMTEPQYSETIQQMFAALQEAGVMKWGGQLKKYKDGNPPTGKELVAQKESAWQTDPTYQYGDLASSKTRLKQALTEWGLNPADFPAIDDAKNISELGSVANQLQQTVISTNKPLATDFGKKIAPTRKGIEYIVNSDKAGEIITDPKLLNKLKEAKTGSFKDFSEDERNKLSSMIQSAYDKKLLGEDYAIANFNDSEWYFRYPSLVEVPFESEQAYKEYLKDKNVIGDNIVVSDKTGLYIKPTFPTKTDGVNEGVNDDAKTAQTPYDKLDVKVRMGDDGRLYIPPAVNLPPSATFPHVKREYRTELVDPMTISAENALRENYRTQDATLMNMDNLPIGLRGAAGANLTAITEQNNANAIMETERINAQNKQQVEQMNVQLNNQDELYRYEEIPRYEAMQLTALEKTKNDLYNYFNTQYRNQMNRYNYENQYRMITSLFPDVTTNPFGTPEIKKDSKIEFLPFKK